MAGLTAWVGSIQQRLDTWARQHRDLVSSVAAPLPPVLPLPWRPRWQWTWRWPWQSSKESKEELEKEYKRRNEQLQNLCRALKAEDVTDLKDILGAMVLSECVYKRPDSEVIRAVNNFKADFGEQLVSIERVQASLDHVPHRYLLAESGNTLFASFIGTKHYKDMITDVNILQRALFHEDSDADNLQGEEDPEAVSSTKGDSNNDKGQVTMKQGARSAVGKGKRGPKPAAHRGFLARAKGIPAIELCKLAKKKDCRLVLCGHSLGGAVAVLTTLAILKVLASSSLSSTSTTANKSEKTVEVKCITFSQPPVGNAALRDYVHEKGWHGHFRTYCIPEDIIPRILSPAYFHHYHSQAQLKATDPDLADSLSSASAGQIANNSDTGKLNASTNEGESIILGLGHLQKSLRRISRLVPLVNGTKPLLPLKHPKTDPSDTFSRLDSSPYSKRDLEAGSGPFGIPDASETAALASGSQVAEAERSTSALGKAAYATTSGVAPDWRSRVPSLPSYIPFGQLFLLGLSSVEPLSASEFTRLTSMQSVFIQLRERFQSHTMRSYRSRFGRIHKVCTGDNTPPNFSMEQVPYMPHLQQWLGLPGTVVAELGKIAEPLIIRSATSLVPVGWTGLPGEKKGSPFRVELCGYGLHLCSLVRAQINGQWCSATVESFPAPNLSMEKRSPSTSEPLQRMRIRIGPPVHESSQHPSSESIINPAEIPDNDATNTGNDIGAILGARSSGIEGLSEVIIQCSSDFETVSQKVVLRLRRVRLLGLEGAGKTSLYYALLGQGRGTIFNPGDGLFPDVDRKEGIAQGVAYVDPVGVSLQDLASEVDLLREELSYTSGQLEKKVDLVILVHNLAHKIPRLHQSVKPALSVLLDEVASAGVPHVLAITNKFAVSADRRQPAAATVMKTYEVPANMSVIVNSCPYAVHGIAAGAAEFKENIAAEEARVRSTNFNGVLQGATQRLIAAPINLVQLPFRKREVVLPVQGVNSLRALVNRVLLDHEDAALMELSREHLLLEMKKELSDAVNQAQKHDTILSGAAAASAVGASLGMVIAILAAAAASLRKP